MSSFRNFPSMILRAFFALSVCGIAGAVMGQADYKRFYDEDNLPRVRQIFQQGGYDFVVQICDYSLSRGQPSWEWRTLRFQALEKIGRYDEAVDEAIATTNLFPDALGALLRAYELFARTGSDDEAAKMLAGINRAASSVPKRERTPRDYVELGQAALVLGADPGVVLEKYFGQAKAAKPKGKSIPDGLVDAFIAAGELALRKDDYARAASEFQEGLKLEPDNPDLLFGLARAFLPNDRETGERYLSKVIEAAPLHIEAMLLQAEAAINFELYNEARGILDLVEKVNPLEPRSAAYRAVLEELEFNDKAGFNRARGQALEVWSGNPEIDYLIGRVLSRKYRYREGVESQLRALEMNPDFLPSKLQLALDYLRLGEVDRAWPLAAEVGEVDEYNVLAYNLEILKREIESFASVETDDFIIRLPVEEAEIYGDRVVDLLTEAKKVLGEKYGLTIEDPTLVEFYPNQQDFAIRSFGSLGGQGLLGVCFGSVVTMNSPGSVTAGKNNWEATLWHEYCHVVTLTATKNKMPRWLSEGISVYEEIQRNDLWGQTMTPSYRKMILEEEALTPISEMSQAFFQAKSGQHIMFAYYQSMLVVEFIVDNFGMKALRGILADLGDGALINEAIAAHTIPMEELEIAFRGEALQLATDFGKDVDWTVPDPEEVNPVSSLAVAAFLKKNPRNFWALQSHLQHLIEKEQWTTVVKQAERLIGLLPRYTGPGNGYGVKATAYRKMDDKEGELAALEEFASHSAEAFDSFNRLIDVGFETESWESIIANAGRSTAINPFLERTHYCSACAHAALDNREAAVGAFERSLKLAPKNPSEVNYRLARVLQPDDANRSKRHVMDALADSPRYRDAYALLRELNASEIEEGAVSEPSRKEKARTSPERIQTNE
jgi:tetratricopeptide (TPR) repeat protein